MTSKARTAAWGVGSIAVTLLASGCQSHVGTAATVGSERVSTKTLNTATAEAALTTSGKTAGTALEGQVLSQLVGAEQVFALAKKVGVSASAGAVEAEYEREHAENVASSSDIPPSIEHALAQSRADQRALSDHYLATGGKADAAELLAFPVADEATAEKALGAIAKAPGNFAALAKQYSSDPTYGNRGGDIGVVPLAGLPTGITSLKLNQVNVVPLTDQGVILIVKRGDPRDQGDLTKGLATIKVTVNPRFGVWTLDPTTNTYAVKPAASDIVAPAPSVAASVDPLSGATASEAPGASAPAPEATAPEATAPAATAPVATAPVPTEAAATAGPASAVPSAVAASASVAPAAPSLPSATPAPTASS